MAGRVNLRVTEQAYSEVSRAGDSERRQERIRRLRTFGRLEVPPHQRLALEKRAEALVRELFPNALSGSRTNDHNRRDCLQLATHEMVGRDLFVTRDAKLRRRVASTSSIQIEVVSPEELLVRVTDDRAQDRLASVLAISVRDAELDADEASIREVLAPLADDYPSFGEWLNGALTKAESGRVRLRVGLVGDRVGAVALSTAKDERVIKLSAFYVADWARAVGLGQHLLWSEIRSWALSSIEKAYVTVSSRHGYLVEFFQTFGFLVEGVSARRYQDDTAEIVLAKHLVREAVADDGLDAFASSTASRVFGAPASMKANPATWALLPRSSHPRFVWSGTGAATNLNAEEDSIVTRQWDLLTLETIFHPARFLLEGRKALVVPIRPAWAEAMLDFPAQQLTLALEPERSERLLLRSENAYYCHPTALETASPGTPILFLVTGGRGIVGEARIIEAIVAEPEELFARFGGLGVYGIKQIRQHIRTTGPRAGKALAMRFGLYVPFDTAVGRGQMRTTLGRNLQAQTITPIAMNEFDELRRIGGLSW